MIDTCSLRHNWFPKAVDLDSLWKAFFCPILMNCKLQKRCTHASLWLHTGICSVWVMLIRCACLPKTKAFYKSQQRESLHMKCRHKTIPRKTPSNLMHSVAGKLLSSKCRVSLQCRAKPCRNVWRVLRYKIKINIFLLSLVCLSGCPHFPFLFAILQEASAF